MANLTREEMESFLKDLTGTANIFDHLQKLGIYGSKEMLFASLKSRLEYAIDYSGITFDQLKKEISDSEKKHPEKKFEAINEVFYQDKLHPVIMHVMYGMAEPFILRSVVKQEMLYLAFKLSNPKKIFIGGVGCGEILNTINNVPLGNPLELEVKGVDISKPSIEFCEKRKGAFKFKSGFECLDLDLSDMDSVYDLSELSEVLEHVRDPQKLLQKVGAKSKYTFVTIPLMLDVAEHIHLFDMKSIIQLIRGAGLDIVYYTVRNSFYVRQMFFFGLLKNNNL